MTSISTRMGLARTVAARCAALRQEMLDAGTNCDAGDIDAAPERRAFDELLARRDVRKADLPLLYEDFLTAFAPHVRRSRGIYYTPDAVVGAQVRLVADLLESRFACHAAFGDERVVVVDPAAGSGAYPLAVAADDQARAGRSPSAVANRLRLFEPMVGAASIARARLATALGTDGVHVAEQDVLAVPLRFEAPILVCLGNPPYNRQSLPLGSRMERKGGWVRFGAGGHSRPILEDFFAAGAGRHAKNLYNDYVYFWRWAVWAVLEQRTGPGIVSFVTAASYLRGPAFGGLRAWLRRAFDDFWILDLEGDRLAARRSDNVFPIRTPVAVAMGVRYAAPNPDRDMTVRYSRLAGSRPQKLAALDSIRRLASVDWQTVDGGCTAPFVPRVQSDYQTWPMLTQLFPLQLSGAQLKRTWPIGPTPAVLRERWRSLLERSALDDDGGARAFKVTRDRGLDSSPTDLREPSLRLAPVRSLAPDAACIEPVPYAYRSFDRQWVLPDARLGDFMRPALWRIAGPRQIFLTSLLTNVLGPGPAAVATALVPDLDHFRGSYGGRAVIPLWCDARATRPNLADGWLDQLKGHHGVAVSPTQWLAYCYALLGTRAYVVRFEEELRVPGARIPVTGDPALFQRAVALGERLLRLHTYGQRSLAAGTPSGTIPNGQARCLAAVGEYPREYTYQPLPQILKVGSGCFAPVSRAAWAYSISGMRVLDGWLLRRIAPSKRRQRSSALDAIVPTTWTGTLTRELLELVWLLEATLDLEPALDAVLDEILSSTIVLTRSD